MKTSLKLALAALVATLGACAEFEVRTEESCYRAPCTHTIQEISYVPCSHYAYAWVYCCCHPAGGHTVWQPVHACDAVTTCVALHPAGHWVCCCGSHHDNL